MKRLAWVCMTSLAMAACGGRSSNQAGAEATAQGGRATASTPQGTATAQPGAAGAQQGIEQMAKGLEQMAQGFQQMSQNRTKPVDFEQLVAILTEVDGWTRSEPRGEQLTMPIAFSRAEARYRRDEAQVEVTIQDTALNQMLIGPMSLWFVQGFEERSSDGYKRYAAFEGHPGFEEWNSRTSGGEVTVFVAKRFILSGKGTRVPDLDAVKRVLRGLALTPLVQLAGRP